MKKFWKSKKFWLIFLTLIIIGLLFYFFYLVQDEKAKIEIQKNQAISSNVRLPASSVYRYDFEKREYFSDKGEAWQNSDFIRYIYDIAPEGSELYKCYYFIYDNILKKVSQSGTRKCNSKLTVTVGQDKACSSQGEQACTLYVYAVNSFHVQGEITAVIYHIDWEKPNVGKVFTKENEESPIKIEKEEAQVYKTAVSDNTEVSYCWLYLDKNNIGAMEIEPFPCQKNKDCTASLSYQIAEGESHTFYAKCTDHYQTEKGSYLNVAYGVLTEAIIPTNHPPQISFCQVSPVKGNNQTNFAFNIGASDPDNDNLSYKWNFGDGENSEEEKSFHQYLSPGIYKPEVIVSDNKGEEVRCSTAWVTIGD